MTVAEYGNSSVADAFKGQDKSYMVLKIDDDTVIVESFNMQAVPKTAEDEAQAERAYLEEVKEKRRIEKQMEQQQQ